MIGGVAGSGTVTCAPSTSQVTSLPGRSAKREGGCVIVASLTTPRWATQPAASGCDPPCLNSSVRTPCRQGTSRRPLRQGGAATPAPACRRRGRQGRLDRRRGAGRWRRHQPGWRAFMVQLRGGAAGPAGGRHTLRCRPVCAMTAGSTAGCRPESTPRRAAMSLLRVLRGTGGPPQPVRRPASCRTPQSTADASDR